MKILWIGFVLTVASLIGLLLAEFCLNPATRDHFFDWIFKRKGKDTQRYHWKRKDDPPTPSAPGAP